MARIKVRMSMKVSNAIMAVHAWAVSIVDIRLVRPKHPNIGCRLSGIWLGLTITFCLFQHTLDRVQLNERQISP